MTKLLNGIFMLFVKIFPSVRLFAAEKTCSFVTILDMTQSDLIIGNSEQRDIEMGNRPTIFELDLRMGAMSGAIRSRLQPIQ